jgi:Fic-DOC domain mobile mystery protein B
VTDLFEEPEDGTPLESAEREDQLQTWITHRNDLNVAEQENIALAADWVRRRRVGVADLLSEAFVRRLHRQMLGEVWRWAGTYRQTERNIGIQAYCIAAKLAGLLGDTLYWVKNDTFPAAEIAIRFHHRLVSTIIPKRQWSSCAADDGLFVECLGRDLFSGAVLATSAF